MRKPQRDPIREDRIDNQAIVDAYNSEEKAMGWYYYLEGNVRFPFRATCTASEATSPLRKGDAVEVQRMASENDCSNDMLVVIRWQGRKLSVPLSKLAAVHAEECSAEAIADWHYWVARGYLF